MLLAYLLAIIDAIRSAVKAGHGRKLKYYNRWSVYVTILVVVCGFTYLIPEEPDVFENIKTFKIPSGSMEPAIEAGDYVVCNLMYYRTHDPRRGDVIIFKYPRDESIDYIKRVVGLPGDTIELRGNTLYVNEQKVDESYTVYGGNGNGPAPLPRYYGPYFISENEYFVMGDNRDNSSDSRDFGSVERNKIEGKAIFVYFSWDMEIPQWNIPGRLASIRLSRIGQIL
jgi:signal peptidase I